MEYAEKNVAATLEFAQKLMQAKNAAEVMGLQSEFLGRQMQAPRRRSTTSDKARPKW